MLSGHCGHKKVFLKLGLWYLEFWVTGPLFSVVRQFGTWLVTRRFIQKFMLDMDARQSYSTNQGVVVPWQITLSIVEPLQGWSLRCNEFSGVQLPMFGKRLRCLWPSVTCMQFLKGLVSLSSMPTTKTTDPPGFPSSVGWFGTFCPALDVWTAFCTLSRAGDGNPTTAASCYVSPVIAWDISASELSSP